MTKLLIEDPDLRKQVQEYLELNGTEVTDETPISVMIPGAAASPKKCASGSGLMTSVGKFAPGYDAKLKSALYHIVRGTPDKIPVELTPKSELVSGVVGPMDRAVEDWTPELAIEALDEFHRPHPTIKPPKAPKEPKDAEVEGGTDSDGNATGGVSTKAGRKRAAAKAAEEAASEPEATEDTEATV